MPFWNVAGLEVGSAAMAVAFVIRDEMVLTLDGRGSKMGTATEGASSATDGSELDNALLSLAGSGPGQAAILLALLVFHVEVAADLEGTYVEDGDDAHNKEDADDANDSTFNWRQGARRGTT